MALLNIFDIAGSALTAQSQRLNVAASNLANADSVTGPDGEPYRANVDVVGEMVNTMSASRSYQANVEVLNTVKSMMLKTLTLGQ